jgi:hypothetical protein
VTEDEGTEGKLSPEVLCATTENVYLVPLLRPKTVHDRGPEVHVHVTASGVEVTV